MGIGYGVASGLSGIANLINNVRQDREHQQLIDQRQQNIDRQFSNQDRAFGLQQQAENRLQTNFQHQEEDRKRAEIARRVAAVKARINSDILLHSKITEGTVSAMAALSGGDIGDHSPAHKGQGKMISSAVILDQNGNRANGIPITGAQGQDHPTQSYSIVPELNVNGKKVPATQNASPDGNDPVIRVPVMAAYGQFVGFANKYGVTTSDTDKLLLEVSHPDAVGKPDIRPNGDVIQTYRNKITGNTTVKVIGKVSAKDATPKELKIARALLKSGEVKSLVQGILIAKGKVGSNTLKLGKQSDFTQSSVQAYLLSGNRGDLVARSKGNKPKTVIKADEDNNLVAVYTYGNGKARKIPIEGINDVKEAKSLSTRAQDLADKWVEAQAGYGSSDATDFAKYGGNREEARAQKYIEYLRQLTNGAQKQPSASKPKGLASQPSVARQNGTGPQQKRSPGNNGMSKTEISTSDDEPRPGVAYTITLKGGRKVNITEEQLAKDAREKGITFRQAKKIFGIK